MAIKIMLDPGHAGNYYNASPVVPGYYESAMTWKLAQKLKKALEAYGFTVGLTRQTINEDPELTERGRRARGYDLFISLHSNAAANEKPDAPWIIHFTNDKKTSLDEKSKAVAHALGGVISKVMNVSDPVYYTKGVDFDRDGNGYLDDEYYGVLFGAKSVGVPGVILEHSFHTNKAAAEWLMRDKNLMKLAEAEAEALAEFYGMKGEKQQMEELKKQVEKLTKRVEELEDQAKVKWAYIDGNLPKWAAPTIKKLANRGVLKGNTENSFELSRLFMRILVILDRAGVFN